MKFKGESYLWNITDHDGWCVDLKGLRDVRLGELLNQDYEEDDRFLYSITLHHRDSSANMLKVVFYPLVKILDISSIYTNSGISMKFNSENIKQSENIIKMILEPNELEVFPKYKI